MATKGFLAISYQDTRKVKAGYKPSHTNETLSGFIVCYVLGIVYNQFFYDSAVV